MPRGQKACTKCGKMTGPRAWYCSGCNHPFVIKGQEVPAEKILERKLAKQPSIDKEASEAEELFYEVTDYFVPVQPSQRELQNQGPQVRVWESKDGKYRLRWSKEFMGVSIEHLHGRQYTLLKNKVAPDLSPALELIRRFKTMQGAIKGYIMVINGIPFQKPEDKKVKQKKKLKRILKGIRNGND